MWYFLIIIIYYLLYFFLFIHSFQHDEFMSTYIEISKLAMLFDIFEGSAASQCCVDTTSLRDSITSQLRTKWFRLAGDMTSVCPLNLTITVSMTQTCETIKLFQYVALRHSLTVLNNSRHLLTA